MKLPYRKGTWFAVPLVGGGYGVGVVARHGSRGGVIFAYFFGPRMNHVPQLDEVENLCRNSAVKALRLGDLALIKGIWPIIGHMGSWYDDDWPMPSFYTADEISNTVRKVEYSDEDPSELKRITPMKGGTAGLERDAVFGYGAVEKVLTRVLPPAQSMQPEVRSYDP